MLGWWAAAPSVQAAPSGMVRVPRLHEDVISAYARLHALGLRVSIPQGMAFDSQSPPQVAWMLPGAGRRIRRGSIVRLYLSRGPARAVDASGRLRRYRVPRLVGAGANAAYAWTRQNRLIFRAYLAPLRAGNAPGLLANYRVTRQTPAAGSPLALGRQLKRRAGRRPGFRATPLSVWAVPQPPIATTGSVRSITQTGVILTGSVDPKGEATTYHFAYGPSTAYGSATPARQAGWGNTPITAAASISGLQPATIYHYRLVATSRAGTTSGADETFTTAGSYQNPVYGTGEAADPFILDNGGTHSDYWAYVTGFRFPMLHSTDLVHWTAEGAAMSTRPSWVVKSGDWHPWAPSLLVSDEPCPGSPSGGCYVMYYTGLSAQFGVNCIGVATSPLPGGPFVDQGPLDIAGGSAGGMPIGCGDATSKGNIDPSPFVDPSSGQPYLYVSTNNACTGGSCTWQPTISVLPLSADFLHVVGSRVALFAGDPGTWEAAGIKTPTVEGPAMTVHDGTYYLFYSGGNWQGAYGMGYATSSSPTGPFTKSSANPILAQTSTVIGPGGGDRLVTGPHDGVWLAYAARSSLFPSPRTLRIDPLSWASASSPGAPDAPVVNGPTSTPQLAQP